MKHGGPTGVKNEVRVNRSTLRRDRHAEVTTQWLWEVPRGVECRALHEALAVQLLRAGAWLGALHLVSLDSSAGDC
jgi:hypothetical protein